MSGKAHRSGRHKSKGSFVRRGRVFALAAAFTTSVGIGMWSAYGLNTDTKTRPASSTTASTSPQSPRATVTSETSSTPTPRTPTTQPPPLVVPADGNGQFRSAKGQPERTGTGTTTSYRVEVEEGLPWEPDEFAAIVEATLADKRGWVRTGRSFQRNTTASLRVRLATPSTVDRLCAPLQTRGEVSCRNGNLVVLNAKRWNLGIEAYKKISEYRRYVVNHEVGHVLGYGHRACPSHGQSAPVMQQQTKDMQSCRPNPWPTAAELSSRN